MSATRFTMLTLFFCFTVISCSEQECCALPEEITMVGTWKLSKLCFSNGASACEFEDMWDAEHEETITFTEQNEFTFNNEGVICSGYYARFGEIDVELTAESGDCSFDETVYFLTSLTSSEMIFSPRCIEGCPHLYIRQ